ncbi:MAG: peptide deformylase [Bacteroidales bacterium]|nr:peptide deformylase [Bacteroidales bacterium]
MVLPVYVYGMSVLRKIAPEIPEDYKELDQLIADMFETMRASDGIGLAAPQVGKSMRIFVVDTSPVADAAKELELAEFKKVFINPYILEEWGDPRTSEEGCLSLPNIREDVTRPSYVRIEYYDENWNLKEEEYDGIRARVIQHEYDHLEGKLFVDRISPLRRKLLSARLNAISHGRADCDYRMVYPKK